MKSLRHGLFSFPPSGCLSKFSSLRRIITASIECVSELMANCLPPAVALPVGAFRRSSGYERCSVQRQSARVTIRHRHLDAPLTFRATSQLWETKRETGKDVVIGFYKGEGRAVQTTRAGDGRLFIYQQPAGRPVFGPTIAPPSRDLERLHDPRMRAPNA
jgi:hypothetical protein